MEPDERKSINDFWLTGINYRKSDAVNRGNYAINSEQYERLLLRAGKHGISEVFVLSTCNRTEIYGFAQNPDMLANLLCSETEGDIEGFRSQAYAKSGNDAIYHIFNVAAGLDSQILGDYEIVGQMKQAYAFAKKQQLTGAFTDRLFNTVLQSSRAIRSETNLSSGTVSVSHAAVQYIKNRLNDCHKTNILVIGSGEIGQNFCKNWLDEFGHKNITIINRTFEKAQSFADSLGLEAAPVADMQRHIQESDIIIVATAAAQPVLTAGHFAASDKKIVIDFSIPKNVDDNVLQYKDITLVGVDELSKINDTTLRKRQAEAPKAQSIIMVYIHQFAEWYLMQQHVPVIKEVKEKLHQLNTELEAAHIQKDKDAIQKALNTMAVKMRKEEQRPGCSYIETIHNYLADASA